MYILDNKNNIREFYINKRIKPYLITTVFCVLFAYVYSLFAHGVSSPYMTYLFLYPLFLGVLNAYICMKSKRAKTYCFFATHFYHTGVVTLMLSSMLRGIFEIAGTASIYQTILTILGVVMIISGGFCLIAKK